MCGRGCAGTIPLDSVFAKTVPKRLLRGPSRCKVVQDRRLGPLYQGAGLSHLGREYHSGQAKDERNRLSRFWTPTGGIAASIEEKSDSHGLLVRYGFLRQAYAGVFQLLPLGLRVQDKIERLIDKHMKRIGASRLSLASLSSQALWERSGRLDPHSSEFFRLVDRKGSNLLLSPTHEEEITELVSGITHSYNDLPLRLYQISKSYHRSVKRIIDKLQLASIGTSAAQGKDYFVRENLS